MAHGMVKTRAYNSWCAMLSRCRNPNNNRFHRYGGRGIKVCARWLKFENFVADMGQPPPGMTLDRIDGDGDYKPSNCRWATQRQQQNKRCNNTRITVDGVTRTLKEWERVTGISYGSILYRIKKLGMSPKAAVSTPLGHRFRRFDGEQNPSAKLSRRDVIDIRKALQNGALQTELAKKYGVEQGTISSIYLKKSWKDV